MSTAPPAAGTSRPVPAPRSALRAVAIPAEHGGWGLTIEPAVLGLLVAPSVAGVCLAVAAVVAFMARTPLKVVLVDRHRDRHLERTALAGKVLAVEAAVLVALAAAATVSGDPRFWVAVAVAAPLVTLELWFDMRSRSRRLVPELAGAAGVCAVAAAIVLADGDGARLAAAVALVPAARVVTSIPFVRAQIARIHGRSVRPASLLAADAVAVAVAGAAVAVEAGVAAGAVAVAAVIVVQRIGALGPLPRPGVLGARQMALGFGVVVATALGVLAP